MAGTIYALLVGIDAYPRSPLTGCVNDVRHFEDYLRGRFGDAGRLRLEVLRDGEATRGRIIERFRAHLGQAERGDTALFFFAGHGSQERPPERYEALDNDGWSQTLMAHDSFTGHHLADKELAVLIAEVERDGPHVLVILDSCHSGTGTREIADPEALDGARRVAPRENRRPFESYWFAGEPEAGLAPILEGALPEGADSKGGLPTLPTASGWNILPYGPHVLLAACEDRQVARECTAGGEQRGVFSYYLSHLLPSLGPETTYQQLFTHLRASVRHFQRKQVPQAEGNLQQRILGGLLPALPRRFGLRRDRDQGWVLEAGYAHGLQPATELRVLDPTDPEIEVARVRLGRLAAGESSLTLLSGALPEGWKAAEAEIDWLPLPQTTVTVEARGVDSTEIEDELSESVSLRLTPRPEADGLLVLLDQDGCRLRRASDEIDLYTLPPERADGAALREALEHIGRWDTLAALRNPGSPLAGGVELRHYRWRARASGASSEPRLDLLPPAGELWLTYGETLQEGPTEPRLALEIVNRTDRELHYGLVALDESFGVTPIRHGAGRVAAGDSGWIRKLDGIQLDVPDELHARAVTQRRDLFLLLLSESPVDLEPLRQGKIGSGRGSVTDAGRGAGARGYFESLLWRAAGHEAEGTREADSSAFAAELWDVSVQPVVTERPMPWLRLDGSGKALQPMPTLTVAPPAGLRGSLRLHTAPAARRRAAEAGNPLPNPPADLADRLRPLTLSAETIGDPGLSVLELRIDPSRKLPRDPHLELAITSAPGESERLAALLGHGATSELVLADENEPARCAVPLRGPTGDDGSRGGRTAWVQLLAVSS